MSVERSGAEYHEPYADLPQQTPKKLFEAAYVAGSINPEKTDETTSDIRDDTEPVLDPLQLRERNYITGIFGSNMLDVVTVEDRECLAVAVNHMQLFDRRSKSEKFDSQLERLRSFFSDMTYEEIEEQEKLAGRVGTPTAVRTAFSNMKKLVTAKFTHEQAQLVLDMVQGGKAIDWEAVGKLSGEGIWANEAKRRSQKVSDIQKEATSVELKAYAKREQIDLAKNDAFMMAYHPPKDWQQSQGYVAYFDEIVVATIERAAAMEKFAKGTTRLTEANANEIKARLGLPVVVKSDTSLIPKDALAYLSATESFAPGRLAVDNPRVRAMRTTLRLFTSDKLSIDDVIEKFGGNLEAGLLLKGAVAELMTASMKAAVENRQRYRSAYDS